MQDYFFGAFFIMYFYCERDMRFENLLWSLHCVFLQERNTKCNKKICFFKNMISYNNTIWKCNNFLGYF
jgi:hypothetical protein